MTIDISKLKGHVPDSVLEQLPETIETFKINTVLRLTHFLSQCSHESNGFTRAVENLNYSADGLKKIFGKYFPNDLALSYARQPEKIANRVYANRLGNGDEASKEGFKFRGRGFIQLTGKNNYKAFGSVINVDLIEKPELVETKYSLLSAAWYFSANNLFTIADLGSTDEVITKMTKKINGGTIGLDDRIAKFKIFYNLLK